MPAVNVSGSCRVIQAPAARDQSSHSFSYFRIWPVAASRTVTHASHGNIEISKVRFLIRILVREEFTVGNWIYYIAAIRNMKVLFFPKKRAARQWGSPYEHYAIDCILQASSQDQERLIRILSNSSGVLQLLRRNSSPSHGMRCTGQASSRRIIAVFSERRSCSAIGESAQS